MDKIQQPILSYEYLIGVETNYLECNYEGGDCCGTCIVKNQCSQCPCLKSDVTKHNTTNALVGGGYCNDETNVTIAALMPQGFINYN